MVIIGTLLFILDANEFLPSASCFYRSIYRNALYYMFPRINANVKVTQATWIY